MDDVANQDAQHLKLLSLFHFVVAALLALFSCIFLIHLVIGIGMIVNPHLFKGNNGALPPPFVGWLFALMGGFAVLLGWTVAFCMILTGRFLIQRKKYTFCLVVAAASCVFTPLGTILGIFTIIVLMRPSVKEMFKSSEHAVTMTP
jgi:hypothetical protein